MRRYRIHAGPSDGTSYRPANAVIEIDRRDGQAYLVFDGARVIRADHLAELLGQLRLTENEIEPA